MAVLETPIEPTDGDLRALLAVVPTDPFAAFVLADYLEEQSDPILHAQGVLLRLVYTLTRAIGDTNRSRQKD